MAPEVAGGSRSASCHSAGSAGSVRQGSAEADADRQKRVSCPHSFRVLMAGMLGILVSAYADASESPVHTLVNADAPTTLCCYLTGYHWSEIADVLTLQDLATYVAVLGDSQCVREMESGYSGAKRRSSHGARAQWHLMRAFIYSEQGKVQTARAETLKAHELLDAVNGVDASFQELLHAQYYACIAIGFASVEASRTLEATSWFSAARKLRQKSRDGDDSHLDWRALDSDLRIGEAINAFDAGPDRERLRHLVRMAQELGEEADTGAADPFALFTVSDAVISGAELLGETRIGEQAAQSLCASLERIVTESPLNPWRIRMLSEARMIAVYWSLQETSRVSSRTLEYAQESLRDYDLLFRWDKERHDIQLGVSVARLAVALTEAVLARRKPQQETVEMCLRRIEGIAGESEPGSSASHWLERCRQTLKALGFAEIRGQLTEMRRLLTICALEALPRRSSR